MRSFALITLFFLVTGTCFSQQFRPPSVPLVAHDPYFSIWSSADNLYDTETEHWTGKKQPMHSIVRIDGKAFRLMGSQPESLGTVKQTGVTVNPTQTIYNFQNESVNIELVFTTPALNSNLDVLSRPVTYLSWKIKSVDGKSHDVQMYFDCGGEIAVNTPDQSLQWDSPFIAGLQTLRIGTTDQPVLQNKGDDLRIDWGYAYLSVVDDQKSQTKIGGRDNLMKSFISSGDLTSVSNLTAPQKVTDERVSMAVSWNVGKVNASESTCWAMLGYDDLYSVRYFDANLQAWWKRNGMNMNGLLSLAAKEYAALLTECAAFDADLLKDLETVGGKKYAVMNALVYRQTLAAHKLVADSKGMPLVFSKENFSNGCMATVDVNYPASPFFFLFSTALTKATLQPIYDYAASSRWKFPFAPHDLGTYPHATGQSYGGGEESEENQMPVEETGNMIIMTAVLAKMEGNASYAKANWPVIEKWSNYLLSKGFDPENQLCTDDFAGHLAHNINLSAKAIVALGSYAMLCEMRGKKREAKEVRKKVEGMVKDWVEQATEGDHTRLAFDKPGTWSQKYNLVWDCILGLDLFPKEMVQREITFYKKQQGKFGLPLDSRKRYTKNDWITWTATMAENQEDFETLFNPIYSFAETTPQRVPLSDWYETDTADKVGFQARSVVGGFFIKMLSDQKIWEKWVAKGTNVKGSWVPLKINTLKSKPVLQTSLKEGIVWKYTTEKTDDNWNEPAFADNNWKSGQAGFGSRDISIARTAWKSSDIWIRRTFDIQKVSGKKLGITIRHDEDAEIYINGVFCGSIKGFSGSYEPILLDKKVKDVLHRGKNTIAIHCHQTTGGQFIDAGLFEY
jgi:hypothetical protein